MARSYTVGWSPHEPEIGGGKEKVDQSPAQEALQSPPQPPRQYVSRKIDFSTHSPSQEPRQEERTSFFTPPFRQFSPMKPQKRQAQSITHNPEEQFGSIQGHGEQLSDRIIKYDHKLRNNVFTKYAIMVATQQGLPNPNTYVRTIRNDEGWKIYNSKLRETLNDANRIAKVLQANEDVQYGVKRKRDDEHRSESEKINESSETSREIEPSEMSKLTTRLIEEANLDSVNLVHDTSYDHMVKAIYPQHELYASLNGSMEAITQELQSKTESYVTDILEEVRYAVIQEYLFNKHQENITTFCEEIIRDPIGRVLLANGVATRCILNKLHSGHSSQTFKKSLDIERRNVIDKTKFSNWLTRAYIFRKYTVPITSYITQYISPLEEQEFNEEYFVQEP